MSEKRLLLGDEAIALGAINAGLSGVYAYPGTPSTEITEFIQTYPLAKERGIHSRWSTNEKTAMEAALGMSYMGKRAMVCMKHVGMNVAADAFVNSAMTGANGGLIVVAADDPSMHSSQNEQDSRFYGKFAMVPIFEPSSQQEAYDMVKYAFDYSEKYHTPVLMRMVTRMAHSRAVVESGEPIAQNKMSFPATPGDWVLMPAVAKRRNAEVIDLQEHFLSNAEASLFNRLTLGKDNSIGIIACGIAYNYLMELYPDGCPYSVLKVSQYPLPIKLILELAANSRSLLVLEDGQPFVEEMVKGVLPTPIPVRGRLSNDVPRTGELTPDNARRAPAARPLSRMRTPRHVHGAQRSTLGILRCQSIQRHRMLHLGFPSALPGHSLGSRHGCINHYGQRSVRCRTTPVGGSHRRLDVHSFRHDRATRRRKRKFKHNHIDFRQSDHRNDRRSGFSRNRTT